MILLEKWRRDQQYEANDATRKMTQLMLNADCNINFLDVLLFFCLLLRIA